jgi:hypothetical protein
MKKIILLFLLFSTYEVYANDGIYFVTEGGGSDLYNLPSKSQVNARRVVTSGFPAYRVSVGYNHDFNSCFGLGFEVGLGSINKTIYYFPNGFVKINSSINDILFVGMWHFHRFDFFLKSGGLRHGISVSGLNRDHPYTRNFFEIVGGGNYNFNSYFALTLSVAHTMGDRITCINPITPRSAPPFYLIMAGIRFTFSR